jgi:hypothetical protein
MNVKIAGKILIDPNTTKIILLVAQYAAIMTTLKLTKTKMETQRQIEILQLLIDKKNKYFITGLCSTLDTFLVFKFITKEEYDITIQLLQFYKPKDREVMGYWFPIGEWQLREEWLHNIIDKLKEEKNDTLQK